MHLLSTRPGGHVEDGGQGVVRVAQTPAQVVVLSAADTTLGLLAEAVRELGPDYPSVRLANLMWLRQPASVDLYVEDVLRQARVVVIDHLGAPSDWAYVVERAMSLARERGQWLAMFSGESSEDPQLLLRSTAPEHECRQLWRYLREGGADNARGFFALIGQAAFGLGTRPPPPAPLSSTLPYSAPGLSAPAGAQAPAVLLVFYRAHVQAGNTAVFDAMLGALTAAGMHALALAVDSLKNPASLAAVQTLCRQRGVSVVLNATHFALAQQDPQGSQSQALGGDAVVLQLITAGREREQWEVDPHGLAPRDLAMQVVLPEIDGRVLTRAISFKGVAWRCERTELDVVRYQPEPERMAFVAELARRWCLLRDKPNAAKRIGLVLANYPVDDSRIANGVGLDTLASTVDVLHALRGAGYATGDALPEHGDELVARLLRGVTNDSACNPSRPALQSLSLADYRDWFEQLPQANRDAVERQWGGPEDDPALRNGRFPIAGLRLGGVFVGIQPARVREPADVSATYHDAEMAPPHHYLAFYAWLRRVFRVDALVHVGTHGNLEWLPGKSVALSAQCWPDAILGPLPHVYPFIVNDPGEGSQAKRRSQAVIIDHLMPALTRAETYGPLQQLERLMDEYYTALALDPPRARRLRDEIVQRLGQHGLRQELPRGAEPEGDTPERLLQRLDAYLCEIKESQIRDGLHVLGRSPRGRARIDTLLALARLRRGPGCGQQSLLCALAQDLQLDTADVPFYPLDPDWAVPWTGPRPPTLQAMGSQPWRHAGHTLARLQALAARLVERHVVAGGEAHDEAGDPAPPRLPPIESWSRTAQVLHDMRETLLPRLDACGPQEMTQLLRALQGRFVPPGPSGAASRGRPDVLPTGRNFYSVDTRAVPTPTAYAMGAAAAERLIERHVQDHGSMPGAVGLSIWGTSTMRTGGEDMAQAFALLGVRPKWDEGSGRVVDIEVLPMAMRNRPRVDVTLRVSGFFRDAFPNLIDLFDTAVRAVAQISESDESDDVNPIRARVSRELDQASQAGMASQQALRQATWRVFGPRAGSYDVGVQELVDSGRWRQRGDLAHAYLESSGFAYGQGEHGAAAGGSLQQRLAGIDAIVHNQDNAEYDLLDSADHAQFQGGMSAAVEGLRGTAPALYHGDFSVPGAPRVRSLREQIARVVRARAVNPKWLEGIRRHGYRGGAEIAGTVDHLFAFGATTGLVDDHQYALLADAYVHDPATREFLHRHNPRALRRIGERLLEAMQRGLWKQPGSRRERIERELLALEQRIEEQEP